MLGKVHKKPYEKCDKKKKTQGSVKYVDNISLVYAAD